MRAFASFALVCTARCLRVLATVGIFAIALSDAAWSHENKLSCNAAAANQPALESLRTELSKKPAASSVRIELTDKLVAVGCYDEAVHILEDGLKLDSGDRTMQTRLKTARSFIGEREYLDKQPAKAANSAEFLRFQLRCKQFSEMAACDQAIAINANDAALWAAKGDALLKERRSQDALAAFNRAQQIGTASGQAADIDITSRINAAQAMLAAQRPPSLAKGGTATASNNRTAARTVPARIYSNIEPASRSN